ncbi:hypothetical protein [Thiohalorhabdus denitrificans]|uniref:Uncharacterized protein n=1 Tax=Thiohalorhabdus denitrificans TaxID=381306 RepID=A0A1G5AH24_9GAMM|nr:hypothetical protein [Thiohalorhabdus denitrificans]SCX77194.1 hypothetical protein SAMN05661077_0350 [Thiohalorhabdus denitrificans]
MARDLQLYADLEVADIDDPEVQEALRELDQRLDRSQGLGEIVTEGRRIHLGVGYLDNNPTYTIWLFQVVSLLVKHTREPSVECQICDSTGDWWSERVYPAA